MFNIQALRNKVICRSTQLIKTNYHHFCSPSNNLSKFPYVFGGIKPTQGLSQKKNQQFKMFFGEHLIQGFSFAYRELLLGLRDKDISFLSTILQKNLLTKCINFPETQLVQSSQIDCKIGRLVLCFGLPFDRDLHPSEVSTMHDLSDHGDKIIRSQRVFDENSCLIVLLAIQTELTSKLKLIDHNNQREEVLENEQQSKEQETHSVQFELQSRVQYPDFLWKAIKIYLWNIFNPKKANQQLLAAIFHFDNNEWKISDIDRSMNTNLPKITDPKK